MRVLHVFKAALPDMAGGVERVIDQIARAGAPLGIRAEVLALAEDPPAATVDAGGYPVHYVKTALRLPSMGVSPGFVPRLAALAAGADVVHYHFPWPFMDLAHFLARVRRPSLVTYHSDIVRQRRLLPFYRPLMHRFLGRMDCIVATSPDYLATSPVLARFAGKCRVVPIGIDPASYPEPKPERLARWRETLPDRFFLSVGYMRYYKGLTFALQALEGTEIDLVLLGDGPERAALEAEAQRRGLGRRVRFLGARDEADKMALLRLAHGFVFPSHLRSEAFGVALVEAAMSGLPLISCAIGTGTSHVNRDGETGLVVPPADPAALRQAMQQLCADPAAAAAMGRAARARFQAMFTARAMAEGYAAIYRELADPG